MTVDGELQRAVEAAPEDLAPLRELLLAGRDVDSPSYHGRTPLCDLVWSGCVPAVELLLEFGADPNAVDRHGMSVLTHALNSGFQGRPSVHQAVVALLKAGANPDGHGPEPGLPRPLALAVLQRERAMAELLLEAGADPLAVDRLGRSVLELAVLAGNEEYIGLLGGKAALEAARQRIPDPEIAVLEARILRLLKQEQHKFAVVRGGYRYMYDDPTEILWHKEQWVEVMEDGHRRSRTVRRGFVQGDEELVAYLLRERGGWEGRTVKRDQLSQVLTFIVPRGDDDLPLRKKRGRR